MIIDETTYPLTSDNYIPIMTVKKQIVIAHTFNHDMRHYYGWKHRYNGKYKKTAPYTINSDGLIYNHFNPSFNTNFFGDNEIDKQTIVILIENDGWLREDLEKKCLLVG